jgi:hypothetical protein
VFLAEALPPFPHASNLSHDLRSALPAPRRDLFKPRDRELHVIRLRKHFGPRLTCLVLGTGTLLSVAGSGCSSGGSSNDGAPQAVLPFGSGSAGSASSAAATPGPSTTSQNENTTGSTPVSNGSEGQNANQTPLTGGNTTDTSSTDTSGTDTAAEAPREIPASYFKSGAWQGSAWTADDGKNIGTTRSVQDFSMIQAGQPFCMQGLIGADAAYDGWASIGFNINQDPFGPATGGNAPVNTVVPTQKGVAVNFTQGSPPAGSTAAPKFRVQLQSSATQEQWCAELNTAVGPAFILYQQPTGTDAGQPFFRKNCWENPPTAAATPYAMQPIDAVSMQIPGGNTTAFGYNLCVGGFADGNSASDAPTKISLGSGIFTASMDGKAARALVKGDDGNNYVINNNAWGDNSGDGTQQIRYTGNSFQILKQTAGPGANNSPASFPSIYIGGNGATTGVNGATTNGSDNLPIQVSGIGSVQTTFNISGPLGDNNATYDVWFAPSAPTSAYQTAQAAFLMVWTYKPGNEVPIGQVRNSGITVPGVPGTWDLWVGPRGGGGPDANLPVMSYVSTQTLNKFTFDLNKFITDAVGRNIGLSSSMYLTDVFAGFEIWRGGTGLSVDEFTAVVAPK